MPSIQEHELRLRHRPRIVVVDAEPASARQTLTALVAAGYECAGFVECESAIATLNDRGADVMVADFASAKTASDLIRRVKNESPETAVILMVANPAVSAAVAAMRQGAFDYLTKPINTDDLTAVVGKAIEIASLRRENRILHEQLDVASMAAAFIAESASSRNLAAIVRRAAPANSPVLIEGESGTGKELIARMLHHWSSRAQGPFVKMSFKMLSPVEPLLAPGDGVARPHTGISAMLSEYVERASGGTLFLDEISEATPEFQSALLRLMGDDAGHRRTAAHCGSEDRGLDQSSGHSRGRGRPHPPRSIFRTQCDRDPGRSPARAARGYSAVGAAFSRAPCGRDRTLHGAHSRCRESAADLFMAGQRARTRKRHRASGRDELERANFYRSIDAVDRDTRDG